MINEGFSNSQLLILKEVLKNSFTEFEKRIEEKQKIQKRIEESKISKIWEMFISLHKEKQFFLKVFENLKENILANSFKLKKKMRAHERNLKMTKRVKITFRKL